MVPWTQFELGLIVLSVFGASMKVFFPQNFPRHAFIDSSLPVYIAFSAYKSREVHAYPTIKKKLWPLLYLVSKVDSRRTSRHLPNTYLLVLCVALLVAQKSRDTASPDVSCLGSQ